MAQNDERLEEAQAHIDRAQGFITDAEFREENEIRMVQYLRAVAEGVIALYHQNEVILEATREQAD
mgnify:CR=1 FL=1